MATRETPCAFLYEPRAAFYTDNQREMQNKKIIFTAPTGKISVTNSVRMAATAKNAGNGVKK
ncbi:hypothetical protein [Metakosakonia massiliensis]|uniref:hypothetical protein n=1 Tax=Phytobacter massiliensis TaxID=1485952 RepID=UPI0002DD97B3